MEWGHFFTESRLSDLELLRGDVKASIITYEQMQWMIWWLEKAGAVDGSFEILDQVCVGLTSEDVCIYAPPQNNQNNNPPLPPPFPAERWRSL